MDLLKPWLAATIEGELGEALRHREDGTNGYQSNGKSRELSYDDGSNLRIPSAKKGPVVQITKFLTFEEPIQVTLSDSVIRVNASITNQASQQYAKKKRRKLTEGTVGGLIQLHEFEIVATHLGPRDKRLTLYVKDFKSLGSDGSGSFGVAPQAIESREGTKELLNKLADLRRHKPDAHSQQSATASPIRSQPSTQTSEAGENQDSLVDFATQVPRSNAIVVNKPRPPDSTTIVNIGSTSTVNSVKSLTPSMKDKQRNPLAGTLNHLKVQAAPQRPSINDEKSLLGLLQSHKRAAPASAVISQPMTGQTSGRTAASVGPAVFERENEASRDILLAPGDDDASGAPLGSQKRKRHLSDNSPRKKAADDHGKKAADDHELYGIDRDLESSIVNHELDKKATPKAAVTKGSIITLRSQPDNPSISESTRLQPNAPPALSFHSISKRKSSASGQNIGRNRISSRDVTIPKDQEKLLNRAESWLPAEPGQREPTANIPISILQTLNLKADLRAQRPPKIGKQRNGTISPSAVIHETADSESDLPVSSGQWPASPERDQLPPDSSLESAEHSDHSVQGILHHSGSVSFSRRQSQAAISTHSMPSGGPSSISARHFSRESGSPSMVSPGPLSPSVTSSSGGEEVQRFTCQAPGCGKSYKQSSGLKFHIDRHHPSTGSFDNFKCALKNCSKSYASQRGLKYHIEHDHDGNSASPSHSGSATPTILSASTPMVPNLQSWSEHDKGSQRKVIDSGADNGSDSLKVSGSIMPLLDRESRTSRDEETCRRYSSARSILKNESPSEAQQTLAQPATTNSDETHFAKNTFSPILPASPTPESDLETSVPLALNEKTDTIASSVPMRRFPSTASQPQDPFTQVKRTPYVNGRVQNQMLPGSRTLSPSSKANLSPLTNANANDDTDFVSASIASVPETSTAETQGENGSFNTVEDQSIEKVVARLADETNSQEGTDSILDKTEELTVEVQQEKGKAEAAANRLDDSTLIMTESPRQSSGSNQLPLAAEANENAHAQTIPEKMPTPEEGHPDPLPRLPTFDSTDHETKRKVGDSSFMSPSVAKRQKRFKVPPTFTSTERPELPRDPSEGARQYRQDFLASRRSSESSTPTTSPRTKFTGFPGTTSENLRDPSERARKFRQEFLASRRSSETSTPTTSPRVQSTALTETIQDRRRNAETEKSVGQVTAHYQSADTEIESQKMTGGKELSPKSQTQVMEQDAAPLPNGNASKEPDGDDAKPGAQDRPSAYYGANSHMFVAHSADVEGPDAEQGTVLEAPSNHETRRAQSIEPNVPFQSPDRQEIEDNLPNAKGNANQTVDPEVGLVIASHAQSAIFHKDDQPMNPESDKVPQDLPVRADEICKQGSNAPTTETILDQVAEPGTAALESVHEQQSIEENADTQMPDEIAIEPTSKQRLIGVDTDTPMPDVQVDQQLTSLRPISHTGEPMNHITPLSFAVTEPNTEDQLHVSSTALESAIPQSSPISDPVMKAAEEHQNAIQPPVEKMEQNSPSVPQNIFDEFKATYPAYPGDVKHFAAICRKIGQLVKVNRMEHQSLWDDFIIRHKIDYPPYLRRCAEEAEDAVSYEGFYQTEIEGPQYQKRVINRRNLDEALTLVAVKSTIEQTLVEPVEQKSTSESDPVENMHHEYTPTSDDEPPKLVGSKIAPEAVTSREIVRKPSKSRVTIDLTEDDPPDEQPQKTKERSVSSQSSVPHLVNGVFVAPPPLQYRRDSSSSLYGVLYTPPAMQGSHVPPPPQSMRSPLVPAMGSTKSTAKSLRRSLPWIGSDHDVLRGSANVTASDSPKRLPGSELREVRTKGSSKSNDAPSQVSAVSSSNAARQSQGLLNTCHRVIQSNWGIKVFELLEPEYYHGQVLPESMIELLAEIASKVNVSEARGRIKEAIHTRIRDNARRGVDHSSQYRKMLKIDLEVVRDVVETSSMSTTSPFSLPHTNAAVAKQDEGTPSKWWDDDNSPFNSFARAYASIRHGSGNSFAKADSAELLNAKNAHQAPGGGVQLKKIDFLGWNL